MVRRLSVFDVVLIVAGSIIGSGIFRTPSVVAQRVHSPGLIIGAWVCGGIIALFGVFVLGELTARRPEGCGVYVHLRDAFHPVVAFGYGWTGLLVSFTGGMAAAAVLFASYFGPLLGLHVSPAILATGALAALVVVNCFGVRAGSNVQNGLMLLKVAAIAGLVLVGSLVHPAVHSDDAFSADPSRGLLAGFGVAMIPVLFAYNGAAVASFMSTETKDVGRALPRGLWIGMCGVVALYVVVNVVCVRVLGTSALPKTTTPFSDVMLFAAGPLGARVVSVAIVLSTLGFISNRMLTAPRIYQAMAQDGLFFAQFAKIDPKTRVPVPAIVLQGALAIVIALSGSYEHILNYVVSTTYAFLGLLALGLFIVRRRDRDEGALKSGSFRVPGHPVSTVVFMLASWAIAINAYVQYPVDGLIGLAILLSAVPVYFVWARRRRAVVPS